MAVKVLAKAGFFAALLKFWKFIALAFTGAVSFIWKKLSRRKDDEKTVEDVAASTNADT